MSRQRLVILNPTCLEVIDAHCQRLDASGVEWLGDPAFASLGVPRVEDVLAGANALILPASIRNLPSAEMMQRHAGLQVLSIAASGWDWLDVEAATANGIVVTFAPAPAGVEAVADMTFALMLAAARQVPYYHNAVCEGRSVRGMGVALWRKTLGIVGLGRIGKAVARRAVGFAMRVLAAEPSPDAEFVRRHGIAVVDLPTALRESDFLSLHVRLDETTRHMIGRRELAGMKRSAFLINTARRDLVDEDALAEAIVHGHLGGAGLDDPPSQPNSPLLGLPHVVFAPHHGNRAIEGVHAVFDLALDNALAALAGRRPEFVVNPQVYAGPIRCPLRGPQP